MDSNSYTGRGSYTGNTTWFSLNETGGELSHTLSLKETPSHSHDPSLGSNWGFNCYKQASDVTRTKVNTSSGSRYAILGTAGASSADNSNLNYAGTTDSKGGGGSHNNTPPYLAVYMWKRTA